MKGVEFRCKREYLGLSIAWLARQLKVDTRTVNRWETMTKDIPDKAAQAIEYLYVGAARCVSIIAIEQIKTRQDGKPLPPLEIPHGDSELPPSWHRMIAMRVAERTGQEIVARAVTAPAQDCSPMPG